MKKRILIAGSAFFDSYAMSFYDTLLRMGHEVYLEDPNKILGLVQNMPFNAHLQFLNQIIFRNQTLQPYDKRLIVSASKHELDLILVFAPTMYNNACIEQIKKEQPKTIIASVFADHLANFGRMYNLRAPYDFCFYKDRYIVDKLRAKLGLNAFYLPQCFDPNIHKCNDLSEEDIAKYGCDITTAGNMYYYKAMMLENLSEYNIKIWGNFASWIRSPIKKMWTKQYVAGEQKAKAFRAAKICINNNHYAEINGVNKRTFEICGCGGFQLTDDSEGLKDVFIADNEVAVFTDIKDLKEKVAYYLNHPEERQKIALAGYKRAINEHTFEHRIKSMFKIMNIVD